MHIQKSRWSKTYEAAEEELIELLKHSFSELPTRITLPDQETVKLIINTEISIWCAEGSMTISNGSQNVALQTGDAVILSSNETYNILSGFTGCVYYQEP